MAMKMSREGSNINQKVANFLSSYQKTPRSTVKKALAMLLMKRIPRSTLNLLVPNLNKIIELIPAEPEHREPPTNIMHRPTRISRSPE